MAARQAGAAARIAAVDREVEPAELGVLQGVVAEAEEQHLSSSLRAELRGVWRL